MAEQLELNFETSSQPVPVLHLRGRLDAAGAEKMHDMAIASLREAGEQKLIIDLAEVEFVASSGLAKFLLLTEEFAEARGTVVFANATPAVIQVISLLNIEQFLKLESSVAAACDLIGV